MISLGDVNFALGADTRDLQRSVQTLQQFGRTVEQTQTQATRSANQIASAFRRQEQATVNALNSTLRLASEIRKIEGGEKYARQATAAFQQLNAEMTRGSLTALQYQRAMERFKTSTAVATRGFKDFATGTQHVNSLAGAMKGLQSSMVLIQGPLGGVAARISTISSLMGSTGFAMAAFTAGFVGAGTAIYKFGAQVLDAGKQVNAVMGQLTAVTGNTEQASMIFRELTQIARHTGQRVQDLSSVFAKFSIAANGTGITMAQVKDTFSSVASVSTILHLNQEQTLGVFKALEQMMSKGTVQAEELRGQLGDRLPGAFQIAARAMGKTTAELGAMMKKGELLTKDFLPKFTEELKKTYSLTGAPIDNYAAAVNNLSTAWFQLRARLDSQLGITNKVMNAYKLLTEGVDWLRVNLDKVEAAARWTGVAMLSIASPAILSAVVSVTTAIVTLTGRMLLLNTVMNKNPLIRITSLAAALAGAVAGFKTFGSELRLVSGELATVGDYIDVLWDKFLESTPKVVKAFTDTWAEIESGIESFFQTFKPGWKLSWTEIANAAITEIMRAVQTIQLGLREIMMTVGMVFGNIMSDIKTAAGLVNSAQKFFNPWTKEFDGGRGDSADADWYVKHFKDIKAEWKSWESLQREVSAMWKNAPEIKTPFTAEQINQEANRRALERIYRDQSRAQDIYKPGGFGTKPFELDPGSSGGAAALSDKELRKIEKRLEAMKAMEKAILDVNREIEGLQMSEKALEDLNKQFAREEEVEKYAKSLRKAGVDTEYITEKTKAFMDALIEKDRLKELRESVMMMRDSFVDAFDGMANALWDSVGQGKDAFDMLKKAAIQGAMDILKTWWTLAALNPLKNALFGTNEKTLGGMGGGMNWGGMLGGLGKLFGGLFGGGGGFSGFEMAWTAAVPGLWNKGGAFYHGMPMSLHNKGDIINTPQTFSHGGGVGRMSELNSEAIMPIGRDSHGNLGVKMVDSGQGSTSIVRIELSQDLVAAILQQARNQSVEISRGTVKGFSESGEFEARAIKAVKSGSSGRRF